MSQQYTQHDRALVGNGVNFSAIRGGGEMAPVLLAFYDPNNNWGNSWGSPNGFGGQGIDVMNFQFPPRITGDNRKGKWSGGDLRGKEPISVFATSGPREITLTWCYIVDGLTNSKSGSILEVEGTPLPPQIQEPGIGGEWTTQKIQGEVNKIRGYFSRIKDVAAGDARNKSDRQRLLVYFKMWRLTGPAIWSCRIESVDVKYSDTLVDTTVDANGASNAYPLRTDVTIALRIWTTGKSRGAGDTDSSGSVIDIVGLKAEPTPSDLWY